jgi:hypothetical protein
VPQLVTTSSQPLSHLGSACTNQVWLRVYGPRPRRRFARVGYISSSVLWNNAGTGTGAVDLPRQARRRRSQERARTPGTSRSRLINSTLARRSVSAERRARTIKGVEREITSILRGCGHNWCRGAAHAERSSSSSSASSDGKTATSTSSPNNNDCRTVHLKAGHKPPNSASTSARGLTSSVTAGGGSVSGSTTGAHSRAQLLIQ